MNALDRSFGKPDLRRWAANASMLLAALTFLGSAEPASAYRSEVTVRDWAERKDGDDLIVVSVSNVGMESEIWFESVVGFEGEQFRIVRIDNSVSLERSVDTVRVRMPSLDRLHDISMQSPVFQTYDLRLMFTVDLMWIEVSPHGVRNAPVLSTVFFVGASDNTYDKYLDREIEGAKFANIGEFKLDVQKKYADLFDPLSPGLIQFPPQGRNAAMYLLATFPQ